MLGIELSNPGFCKHCGTQLEADTKFCPRCGKDVTAMPSSNQVQMQSVSQKSTVGGIDRRFIVIALVLLVIVLVVPVFPRDKIVYADGQTQTVSQSTSYATSYQTITTATEVQLSVYKGNIKWVSDTYYYYYQQYYYQCYYDQYGNWYCGYNYWPYYQDYTGSATIDASDLVVKMEQTNEASGLITITLTHHDGTQDVYRHVVSSDLTKGGVATVQGQTTITNTLTNSVVNPVTYDVACQHCVPMHVTERVSILQMLLGY